MNIIRHILACLALCISIEAIAEPGQNLPPAYQRDLDTIISLTALDRTLIESFQKGLRESTSYTEEQRTALLRLTSGKEFSTRLHAVLFNYLAKNTPQTESGNLVKLLQKPGMTKLFLPQQNTADSAAQPTQMTEKEKRDLRKLENDKSQVASLRLLSTILNAPSLTSTIQAFCLAEMLPVLGTPAEQLALELEGKPQSEAARDAFMAFFLRTKQANTEINQRYGEALRQTHIGRIINLDTLTSLSAIDGALKDLDTAEHALQQYKKDADAELEQSTREFQNLEMFKNAASEIATSWEAGVSQGYARRIVFQENQHKILVLYRRILQFARANNGTFHKQDNQLIFDSTNNVAIYNALLQQVKDAGAEESQILKQSTELLHDLTQDLKNN